MKSLVLHDQNGQSYIYNDDTGIILPFSQMLLNEMIRDGNSSSTDSYIGKYYRNLINELESRVVRLNTHKEAAYQEDSLNKHYTVHGFRELILKTTNQCNMRCKYCIYSDYYPHTISYSDNKMSWRIAKKAIDSYFKYFLATNEVNRQRSPTIAFYGGEPLLGFDIIKKTIEYVGSTFSEYSTHYTVTTNGLLLCDEEIASFLKENDVWIIVSIDGTKENHDRYRLALGQKLTYDTILTAINSYFAQYNNIFSVCCYDFKSDLDLLVKFYEQNDRSHGGTFPHLLRVSRINPLFSTFYKDISQKTVKGYLLQENRWRKVYLDCMIRGEKPPLFVSCLFSQEYLQIHERTKFLYGSEFYSAPSGACVPGDKLCIETDGSYQICEKVCSAGLEFGSVATGLDHDRIFRIIDKYNILLQEHCSQCPVSRVCSLCYSLVKMESKFEFDSDSYCKRMQDACKKLLEDYVSVRIKNPEAFDTMHMGIAEKDKR